MRASTSCCGAEPFKSSKVMETLEEGPQGHQNQSIYSPGRINVLSIFHGDLLIR